MFSIRFTIGFSKHPKSLEQTATTIIYRDLPKIKKTTKKTIKNTKMSYPAQQKYILS